MLFRSGAASSRSRKEKSLLAVQALRQGNFDDPSGPALAGGALSHRGDTARLLQLDDDPVGTADGDAKTCGQFLGGHSVAVLFQNPLKPLQRHGAGANVPGKIGEAVVLAVIKSDGGADPVLVLYQVGAAGPVRDCVDRQSVV